jgi:DNA-binding transcriptional LysR family regulator
VLLLHVESFLAIVRAGGLTQAAESLFISQPALTQRLKLLEADLGATLFRRTQRYGLQLTEAGLAFLPHAERIARAASEAADAIALANRGEASALIIGVSPLAGMAVAERAVVRYREDHPAGAVRIRTGTETEILNMVLGREIEFGLAHSVRHADIQVVPLYVDELVLTAVSTHRLSSFPQIRMRELGSHQLVQVLQTLSRVYLARAFSNGSKMVHPPIDVESVEMAKHLVLRGVGVAFLPKSEVREELADGRLVQIAVTDALTPKTRIVGLRRHDVPLSAAAEILTEIIRASGPASSRLRLTRAQRKPGRVSRRSA